MSQDNRAERVGRGSTRGKRRTQQVIAQEEMDAEEAGDTHSTVWMVHGGVSLVLLDRHTEVEKTTTKKQIG